MPGHAGANEAIGQEHEGAVGERRTFLGLAEQLVEDFPQAQLVQESADDEHGAPGGGFEDFEIVVAHFAIQAWLAAQEALQLRKQRLQHVQASQVGDGALFDLAVLAIGLDDADVHIDSAVGGRHLDGAEVHGEQVSRRYKKDSRSKMDFLVNILINVSLRFQAWQPAHTQGAWKKPGVFEVRILGIVKLTPNMG